MGNDVIKKDLDDAVAKAKEFLGDNSGIVDKIVSLKGQIDIEPTRLIVKETDVIKEYDFDTFRIIRCKQCIIYQVKGGYEVVVSPRMNALHTNLSIILDMKDRYNTLSEDDKKVYNALLMATTWTMNAPLFSVIDDKMFFGIADYVMKIFDEYVKEKENAPLKDEEAKKDAEFENTNEALKIIGGKDA